MRVFEEADGADGADGRAGGTSGEKGEPGGWGFPKIVRGASSQKVQSICISCGTGTLPFDAPYVPTGVKSGPLEATARVAGAGAGSRTLA